MKQYQQTESGAFQIDGLNIPNSEGNRHYRQMQNEVSAGDAEILPYVEPPKHPRRVRDEALEALVHDFGDGRVIQVRPQDEPNFERAYRVFALTSAPSIDWVMADNVKHPVTEAELREAHDAGIVAGAAIWDAYDPEA